MRCSYTTFSITDKSLEQAVELAARYGLDGIELRGKGQTHISPACAFSYVSGAKTRIRQKELLVPCLTAYTRFRQRTVEEAYREVDHLMEMAALAEYLEAGCIRVFLGEIPEGMEQEESDRIVREGLLYASEKMEHLPVRLAIETHDSGKCGRVLAPLLVGLPESIGVLLDILHPWEEGESIEETWRYIGDRIIHVHVKDVETCSSTERIYCRIGEGLLPVQETVIWLESHGYQGFYSLEWEPSLGNRPGVSFEEQLESFIKWMSRIKNT